MFDHFVGLALKGSKATDNSLKTSVTQNLNDTSNQDSVGYKLKPPTPKQLKYQNIKIQPSSNQGKNPKTARSNRKSWLQEIRC